MDAFFDELLAGLPDTTQLARIVFRLSVAALLGGIIGAQRERAGKEAGLRTHMLVALGAALFIVAPIEFGMSNDELGVTTRPSSLAGAVRFEDAKEIRHARYRS